MRRRSAGISGRRIVAASRPKTLTEPRVGRNDKSYINTAKKALDKVIGKAPEKVFAEKIEDNYPKDCNIGALHDSSGIVTFARGGVPADLKKKWNSK